MFILIWASVVPTAQGSLRGGTRTYQNESIKQRLVGKLGEDDLLH